MSKSEVRESVGEITRRDGKTAGALALRDLKWALMRESQAEWEQEEREKKAKGGPEAPEPQPKPGT